MRDTDGLHVSIQLVWTRGCGDWWLFGRVVRMVRSCQIRYIYIYKQAFDFSSPALGGGISISDGDLIEVPLAVFP